jgi:hypothetical protein
MATPIYINHGGISPATGLDGGREPEQNGRRRGDALASYFPAQKARFRMAVR